MLVVVRLQAKGQARSREKAATRGLSSHPAQPPRGPCRCPSDAALASIERGAKLERREVPQSSDPCSRDAGMFSPLRGSLRLGHCLTDAALG